MLHIVCIYYSFFFFQAEDGIRDIGVTGVQTCALPIFVVQVTEQDVDRGDALAGNLGAEVDDAGPGVDDEQALAQANLDAGRVAAIARRSEERRVGKECRSRRSR